MDVILLKDVEKVGLRGDVVSVARGYARNFLLPRRLAEEATAARVALLLQRHGFTRVRPLLGGIDAWREQNYPMERPASIVVTALAPGSASAEPAPLPAAPIPRLVPKESERTTNGEGATES